MYYCFFFFFLFRAVPAAYGTFKARSRIGAAAAAYATATATPDPSHICDLRCSLGQCRILNPLREVRDQTCILMGTSHVLNPLSHNGKNSCIMAFYSHTRATFSWLRIKSDVLWSWWIIAWNWPPACPRTGEEEHVPQRMPRGAHSVKSEKLLFRKGQSLGFGDTSRQSWHHCLSAGGWGGGGRAARLLSSQPAICERLRPRLQGFSPLSPQFVWNGEDEKAQEGKGGARWSITVVLRFEGILIETWLLLYQWAPLGWDHISSLPYGPIDPQAVKVDNRCVIKYF